MTFLAILKDVEKLVKVENKDVKMMLDLMSKRGKVVKRSREVVKTS